MCNVYHLSQSAEQVANIFGASAAAQPPYTSIIFPGDLGLVVVDGEVRTMAWGFPRQEISPRTGKTRKSKPVNNVRANKLRTFSMWKESFRHRRCLIPISSWAEAEGERGDITQTWYKVEGDEIIAVAGIWRPTDEWGDAYSMVITADGCGRQMPVVLARKDWEQWTRGKADDALQLCQACTSPLLIDRSTEAWFEPRADKVERSPGRKRSRKLDKSSPAHVALDDHVQPVELPGALST